MGAMSVLLTMNPDAPVKCTPRLIPEWPRHLHPSPSKPPPVLVASHKKPLPGKGQPVWVVPSSQSKISTVSKV